MKNKYDGDLSSIIKENSQACAAIANDLKKPVAS